MSSHPQGSAPSWSRQEFADLDLGDTRLNARLVHITDALTAQPMSPISTACGDWSAVKAAYRFF
ncbi:IS4 family transposase, partial [Candidatus Poribacteria bacterium]